MCKRRQLNSLEIKNEKTLADQNEAGETSSEVLPQDFIKPHNEVGAVTQAQMTFDQLRGIW